MPIDEIINAIKEKFCNAGTRIDLYVCISRAIIEFLSTEKQILFINIPVEELTINSRQADKYWADCRNAVSLVLRAVAKRYAFTPCELDYPGDWYYSNDNFILKTGNPNQSYLYLKAVDRNNSVYLKFHDPYNRRFNGGNIQNKSDIIRGAKSINLISTLPAQLKSTLRDIKGELELLNSIPTIEFENSEFYTVSLICSPRPNGEDPYAGKYVLPLVWDGTNADIVALLGDRSFGRDQLQTIINRLAPLGSIKKLIVIGSKPTSYLLQQNPTIVTLSFADMYNYCVPIERRNDRHSVGAVFVSVEFPWLTERLNELHERLDKHIKNGYIGSDSARHIYNWIRCFLSHIDFSSEKLECLKENVAFVESIADDDEVIEDVQNWIRGLEYTSDTNPKRDYANRQRVDCLVNLRKSVRNQVAGATGKSIVVDAPIHSGDYSKDDVITTILRYVNYTKELYAVYYKGIESGLMRYSQGNYNKDPLFPHPKVEHREDVATEQAQNDIFDFNLDDYLVNDDTGHFLDRHYSVEQMMVTFTDGTNESIFGKFAMKIDGKHRMCEFDKDGLIVDGENEPIDPLGKEISYYSQVGGDLFNALHGNGELIAKYAKLWHEKLSEYVDKYVGPEDDRRCQFCSEVGISLQVLRNHLECDWTSKFIRSNKKMKNILKKLKENGLITQEELKYVLASRTYFYGSSSSFGSNLKSGLLYYYVGSSEYIKIMESLGLPEDITMDELVGQYLHTKTIQSVNNGR